MNELTLIENGLIKVYETNEGKKVVNARELHEGLGNNSKFADWVKNRLSEVDAVQYEDYVTLSKKLENGGRTKDYILTLNIAKEMAMLERNEKGKEYRRYLISIEEKYKLDPYKSLSPELKAIFITDKKVQAVETRVEKLENTMTIDYGQQQELRKIANQVVVKALGGKSAPAYKRLSNKAFSELWNDYKREMNVNSYRNTATKDFETGKLKIQFWTPGEDLELMIKGANVGQAI